MGRTSVTYAFTVRREDTVVARGRMVTVRSDPVAGGTSTWTPEQRRLLSGGDPQPATEPSSRPR